MKLNQDYTLTLSGDQLHTVMMALGDAERQYRKVGLTGYADNAKAAYLAILSQAEAVNHQAN